MADDIVRCETCKGKKKMMALGGLIKDCVGCSGVGFVSVESVVASVVDDASTTRSEKMKAYWANRRIIEGKK